MADIQKLEKELWEAADNLRANSKLTSQQYCMPVLGLLTFHRVVRDFMIQGGDPNGDGTGGSGTTIKGEFSANGVKNDIAHVRGTISMARSSDYNSASSQFFIVQKTAASLNGQYAAFGNVTDGMDVVDAIVDATADKGDSNGILPKEDQPVIASITMVD